MRLLKVWRVCASMPPSTTAPVSSIGICAVYRVPLLTIAHSSGALFSYSSANLPKPQKRDGEAFKNQDYAPNFNFGQFEILDGLYNQKKLLV